MIMEDGMSKLDKLIQQYKQENPGEPTFSGECGWRDEFVEWLASRPTCGQEQRKFLDEIEKKHVDWYNVSEAFVVKSDTQFHQCDFTADLQKVIKGE